MFFSLFAEEQALRFGRFEYYKNFIFLLSLAWQTFQCGLCFLHYKWMLINIFISIFDQFYTLYVQMSNCCVIQLQALTCFTVTIAETKVLVCTSNTRWTVFKILLCASDCWNSGARGPGLHVTSGPRDVRARVCVALPTVSSARSY